MITCVCLVVEKGDALLLVQARGRAKYYFPGGKIEEDETYEQALIREIDEELNVLLNPDKLSYINTVIGQAYPQKNTLTKLICYKTTEPIDWDNIHSNAEITDIRWILKTENQFIAPAVITWINQISKAKVDNIIFKSYASPLWSAIKNFNILQSDRRFTKTPAENIKLAQKNVERFPTLVFNDNQQLIAFFTLHIGEGVKPYTDNPNAIFFRSFSVDSNFRGEGVGRAVIENLSTYIANNFPTIEEIYLTVNTDNEVALQLYKKCDYCYVGDADLEDKPVHILKYSL